MSNQPQVLNTLDTKRREIESHIGSLEQDLEQARRDLSAILAAIKVFSGEGYKVTAYMNLSRLFPRRELPDLARKALESATDGKLSTIQIATYVMTAKGWTAATGTCASRLRTRRCRCCGGGRDREW
jgi:hypothetical protein